MLQNRDTGEYRFFYASNNLQLLRTPRLIHNQQDLNHLLDTLALKDFPTLLKEQRFKQCNVLEEEYNTCHKLLDQWKCQQEAIETL